MVSGNLFAGWLEVSEIIRLEVFLAGFTLIAGLERLLPCRHHGWKGRISSHTGIQLLNVLVQLVLLSVAPLTLSAIALLALFSQSGILHHLQIGLWPKIVMAWLVLDLASYWWHRIWHTVDWLWRFHRIHHLDPVLDVLTTFRTHPVETILTILFKGGVVFLLGVPLLGVILYEVIVLLMVLWIHANVRIHPGVDRWLAWLLVTPSVHRLHHRALQSECACNFGLVLTIWDRVFGTYRTPGDEKLTGPGMTSVGQADASTLTGMLMLPFRQSSLR